MDLIGIEPMTSSMPWKRAPSCATGPHQAGYNSSIVPALDRFVNRQRLSAICEMPMTAGAADAFVLVLDLMGARQASAPSKGSK